MSDKIAKIISIDGLKHYNDKINQTKQDVLISGQNIKKINDESILGEGNIKLVNPILSLTYSELVSLRDNAQLMPGQQYRITDYVTTTSRENTQSAGHLFDIIVTADDESTLNEVARAIQHDGDTYFVDSDLNAWQIWYCLDNNTDRFIWTDTVNGKGVIYRMIDEFNNDCPYDFKNIQFKHPKDTTTYPDYYYTFSTVINGAVTDHSMLQDYCYGNTIKEFIYVAKQYLNINVFLNVSKTSNCYDNSFGSNCYDNSFGNGCSSNSFGSECYHNSFGSNGVHNTFGNGCNSNSFGSGCFDNSFGNGCNSNTFGNGCSSNSFGSNCDRNFFRDGCLNNSFGNGCLENSFGNNFSYNSFENSCSYNSFRMSANMSSQLKNYVQYNHFDDGCLYNVIWNSDTTSSSIQLKNININKGVRGTSSSYNYINVKSLNSEKEININNYNGHIYIDYGDIFKVTYNELVDLRDNSQLIPGRQYRIIDYITTTVQGNTQLAGHQFDIIVTADDESTLNEVARAIQPDGDTYFADSDLNAWQIWYCLDNDTDRFVWADTTNGKGVIYRMIDEQGNDCPYDFKNIQFRHPKDTTTYPYYYYTFSTVIDGVVTDHSMLQGCYNNIMKEYISSNKQTLNNNVFLNTSKTSSCYSNFFETNCYQNSFGNRCYSNFLRNGCYSNSFGNGSSNNSFGYSCSSHALGNNCSYNTFGNNCFDNTFGNTCSSNSLGNNCYTNSFGIRCNNNSFKHSCSYNTFGDRCSGNSLGTVCNSNTFGNNCQSNSFGNNCFGNSFGNNCQSNSFGNTCQFNSFRISADTSSTLKDYIQYNHFDDGCSQNVIWNSDTTSSSICLQNININRSVVSANSSDNYINIDVLNQDYEIQVAKNSKGEIKIYCEADLIA